MAEGEGVAENADNTEEGAGAGVADGVHEQPVAVGGENVPGIDRTIKVRWVREGRGEAMDKTRLSELFSKFGNIEHAFLKKDRKERIGERQKKKMVATGIVVYSSIVGAHAAVLDAKANRGQIGRYWSQYHGSRRRSPILGSMERHHLQRSSPRPQHQRPQRNRIADELSQAWTAHQQRPLHPSSPGKEA